MHYVIMIAVFLFFFWDIQNFKRINKELTNQVMQPPRREVLLVVVLYLMIFAFSARGRDLIPAFLLFFFYPYYLVKRHELSDSLNRADTDEFIKSDALGVVIAWFFGVFLLSFFIRLSTRMLNFMQTEFAQLIVMAIFSSALLLFLVYQAALRMSDQGFLINVGFKRETPPFVRVILMPTITGIVFAILSTVINVSREIQPQTPLSRVIDQTESLTLIGIFIFLAIITAPFFEEVVFRGYFFRVLERLKGERMAVYAISLSFIALHVHQYWGDWVAIMMITVLGFTLTILRAVTGTTLTSMIMHYVYNAGVITFPVLYMIYTSIALAD